jgi:two-component system, response regulator PdtaR
MATSRTERPVILIVEEEFLIRMHAAQMITEAGYDVVEAKNADDAIVILETRRDIRVVFTDLQIPGSMDGLKLAHAVRHRWPPIHIVATSAYDASLKDELPAGSVFLLKPYTEREIVGTLHALTASH